MIKQDKVEKVMHEWKAGTLTSHGKKVTDYDQAVAIALSEAGLSKYAEGGGVGELSERKRYSVGELKELGYTQISGDKTYRYYFEKDNNKYEFKVVPSVGINSGVVSENNTMLALISKYALGGSVGNDKMKVNITKNEFSIRKDEPNRVFHSYKGNIGDYSFTAETDSNGINGINKGSIYNLYISKVGGSNIARYNNKWEYKSRSSKDGIIISEIIEYIDSISDKKDGEPKYKDMNEYSKGGNVIERRYVNKDEDYEVRYAKNRPSRMGYKDERKFAVGGEIGNTVSFKGDYGTPRSGVVKEKRGSSYIVSTDDGDRLVDSYEVISFSEAPAERKKRFGFFEGGGEILATSPSKDGIKKIIEQYLYGSTITLVETDNDKIYEVHNKKGKTPFHVEVIRGRYKFIQTDKPKFAGGGEIENKIEKLKKVVSSKMLPESVKAKAQAEIDKLEKQLHESKETKAEEKSEHENDEVYIEFLNKEKNFKKDKKYFKTYNDAVNFGKSEIERFKVDMVKFNDEYKETKAEEKDYIEAKTKALEKSLKDKTISETQRKRDEKELALFKGAEAKKPTTRKAPVRKAPVKKAVAKKVEVKKEVETPAKPKADHKKLVAKLKAKKGATPSNEPSKGHKRSESSDKKRSALPLGKRISADGNKYYENRLNRADISKEDKFEDGGEVKGSDWGLNLNW